MNRQHIHAPRHLGDIVSDQVSGMIGSWPFIIGQSIALVLWVVLNSAGWFLWHWDAPPFILLNLCLSFQAGFTAPIIMISQNRQAAKDHLRDDLEAEEVSDLFEMQKTQLEILSFLQGKQEVICPYPKELDEKFERMGWGNWQPTPGVTDEGQEVYLTLHLHVMSAEEALAMSDTDFVQRLWHTALHPREALERYQRRAGLIEDEDKS